ncbi:DUF1272 domain-containing protein [Salipaludibacillus sp. LMS25]|uniref:DUF1272 domain-containing protein n=1 Tax=Salipaludibacillus sp. LMS25 TaxID=2924031 RepID=UPI0034E98BD7
MREKCEKCSVGLKGDSVAYICTHECTFCESCSKIMRHVCPNCGGELARRPKPGKESCPLI